MRRLSGPLTEHDQAKKFIGNYLWPKIKEALAMGDKLRITVQDETRSLDQNSKMWAMLHEVSDQVNWHGNKLTPEEWKIMFTASLKKQRVLPGLDGGFVVMGDSTSKMTISEMSELIELMLAFGAMQEVKYSQ